MCGLHRRLQKGQHVVGHQCDAETKQGAPGRAKTSYVAFKDRLQSAKKAFNLPARTAQPGEGCCSLAACRDMGQQPDDGVVVLGRSVEFTFDAPQSQHATGSVWNGNRLLEYRAALNAPHLLLQPNCQRWLFGIRRLFPASADYAPPRRKRAGQARAPTPTSFGWITGS